MRTARQPRWRSPRLFSPWQPTWNCSPRDAQGQTGPYEAALMDNHPLAIPEQPLEILRTIHSFDPCMACACHTQDADGNELSKVQVQ